MARFRAVAAFSSLVLFGATGCSLLHHEAGGTDAGPAVDAAPPVTVLDAGPVAPPAPDNVNQVGRFPDEVPISDVEAKIADPNVSARNAVPGGALVATLKIGTPVTQIAKHETFLLCTFADPKNPTRTLEGWVAEQAFVPGPTVPSKASCGAGQTRLTIDEQDFCGRVCKNDSDCQSGQVCQGKANLLASGKVGADVTTCTLPPPGAAPAPSSSAAPAPPHVSNVGKPVPGIQMPPLPGNTCQPGYVYALIDRLCHRDCLRSPCPAGARCLQALGVGICEAL
jgi:hypothetical protein